MPAVVSDQSGMNDLLKSCHYINGERPTRVDNRERRPVSAYDRAVTLILLLLHLIEVVPATR